MYFFMLFGMQTVNQMYQIILRRIFCYKRIIRDYDFEKGSHIPRKR